MPARAPARPRPPLMPVSVAAAEPATAADTDFPAADCGEAFVAADPAGSTVAPEAAPLDADIEHVVVLFADGQDGATRALLERLVRTYRGADGLRFWRMYFDLLLLNGDRPGFDRLGLEFAQCCEMSPPAWRDIRKVLPEASGTGVELALQGVLTADDATPLAPLLSAMAHGQAVRLDCGRLLGCDDDMAARLAELLRRARGGGRRLTLSGTETLLGHLRKKLVNGQRKAFPAWCLLLELLQWAGSQDEFEDVAVRFAVTFEQSPPSWEKPLPGAERLPRAPTPPDDALYLTGDIRRCRFEHLPAVLSKHKVPVLDFSAVRRLDFFSAGQLANRLALHRQAGDEVLIRNPNHLVAELLTVVGIDSLARILIPKS